MIGERIKMLRKRLNMSQKKFSEMLDVSLITLQRYEKGEREPSSDFLINLKNKFNVNINWLLTGQGKMFLEEDKGDNKIEKEILELLSNEPDIEKKKALLDFLKRVWVSGQHSSSENCSSKEINKKLKKI
jgi:transcriptional regulator with XRE-family HTH domain